MTGTLNLEASQDESVENAADWEEQAVLFEVVLQPFGQKYVAMWRGAWATLYSNSEDRFRQVAHSARELWTQLLTSLAPDTTFTADEVQKNGCKGKTTRDMRVKRIMEGRGKSGAKLANTLADGFDELYDYFCGVAHDHNERPKVTVQQLTGLLRLLDGLIRFILD